VLTAAIKVLYKKNSKEPLIQLFIYTNCIEIEYRVVEVQLIIVICLPQMSKFLLLFGKEIRIIVTRGISLV